MKLRKIAENDLDAVSKLFNDYRIFYRKKSDIVGSKKFIKDRIMKQDSEIYVCEDEKSELLGFVQLYPLFSSTKMKKFWLLNDLFVNPRYRGKGISIQLINKAKELVEKTNACGMFLETGKSNVIGNKLYPRLGFKINNDSNYYEWTTE